MIMSWTREIVGWIIVVLGLIAFVLCYDFLRTRRIFEAAPCAFIGFILFRGGIHLLKVAVAARICQQGNEASRPRGASAIPSSRDPKPVTKKIVRRPPRQVISQD